MTSAIILNDTTCSISLLVTNNNYDDRMGAHTQSYIHDQHTNLFILLTMYNALIMPHFNYCRLAWGSNIKAGHKLH